MCIEGKDNRISTWVNFGTAIHISALLKFSVQITVKVKKLTSCLRTRAQAFIPIINCYFDQVSLSLGNFFINKMAIAIPTSKFVF